MSKVIGLDIGYSNAITVFGDSESIPETIVRPSRAVRLSALYGDFGLRDGEVLVNVGGVEWVAFAAPGRTQDARDLHEDYTTSDSYEALFKASLLRAAGSDCVIDTLVTGLPVNHARDTEYVSRVIRRMTGTHQVSPGIEVAVNKVAVVSQPIGTMANIYCKTDHGEALSSSVSLVIDSGFFSAGWVLFDKENLVSAGSGMSLMAMSVLLDKASDEIAKDYGGNPGFEKIEFALQSGKDHIVFLGEKLYIKEYLRRAALEVIPSVFAEIKNSLRFLEGRKVRYVILGGGGTEIYEDFARQYLPDAILIKPENIITSNAYGFWLMGR